jgi:hypothetical protein
MSVGIQDITWRSSLPEGGVSWEGSAGASGDVTGGSDAGSRIARCGRRRIGCGAISSGDGE